jgi:hypothetical protein
MDHGLQIRASNRSTAGADLQSGPKSNWSRSMDHGLQIRASYTRQKSAPAMQNSYPRQLYKTEIPACYK